jgi:signal transduction histidine kinase
MGRLKRWNDRTRLLLTFELAVSLPAAGLVGVSVWKLKSMKRDKVVEAAIQRDFSQVLKVAETQSTDKAYTLVSDVYRQFPAPGAWAGEGLDAILRKHPYAGHVFLYDRETGLVFRSQPARMDDPEFRAASEEISATVASLAKIEGPEMAAKLQRLREKEGDPFLFIPYLGQQRRNYTSIALFALPETHGDRVAFGGMAFDSRYLQREFFPAILSGICPGTSGEKDSGNPVVIMVHVKGNPAPLAASAGWDGGPPEIEHNFDNAFPYLTLGIKYRGTTIEALSQKFIRTSFLIVGGLSLFLAAGMALTFRNVAREMALAKLKSDFVSNVSHELRTPLSLIRLFAETLEMGRVKTPEKYQEYFSIIRKESERLTALINNILDFARIEADRKEYIFRETNVAELVRHTLDSYRYQIEQQGFTFQEIIPDDLPPLWVDREAITRSLLNLVNNAMKYSREEKFLAVKVYRDDGAVNLEVADRGIGIPRSELRKIFEKFYRVSDPLVHESKGSGLGLSLVRHIAEAHGGRITVESAPGKGSRFTLSLPVRPPGAPAGDAGAAATPA